MQSCDQTCTWCARNWFRWLKAREGQMSVPRKAKLHPVTKAVLRPADSVTFTEAARTSNRAPRPFETCHCDLPVGTVVTTEWGSGTVCDNAGYVGLDSRHRVRVSVPTTSGNSWKVDMLCGLLSRK